MIALETAIFRVPYTCPTGAHFACLAVLRPRRINNLRVFNGLLGFNSALQHQANLPIWGNLKLSVPKKSCFNMS